MRKIDEIIIHCTATPAGRDVTLGEIRRWHVAGNGWTDIGYHYVVGLDGTVSEGRPLDRPGAHCRGHNAASVGVAYVGGLLADGKTPADTRTPAQKKSLETLVAALLRRFRGAVVRGHRDFAAKACPCFDAAREYSRLISAGAVLLLATAGCRPSLTSAAASLTELSARSADIRAVAESLSVRFEIVADTVASMAGETPVVASGVRITGEASRWRQCREATVRSDSVTVAATSETAAAVSVAQPRVSPGAAVAVLLAAAISVLVLRLRRRAR